MCKLFIKADPTLWESHTRSLRIDGMVTSVRLENFFWTTLDEISRRDGMNSAQLIAKLYNESIDAGHDLGNFTSFLRVCCGRYLALQLSGDIPARSDIPIAALDADSILDAEKMNYHCGKGKGAATVPFASALKRPWIKRITHGVADVVDAQNRQRDCQSRPQHARGRQLQEVGAIEQQPSPGRKVGRKTEAEEGQRRFRDDGRGDAERG